jgi:hypothetical protein
MRSRPGRAGGGASNASAAAGEARGVVKHCAGAGSIVDVHGRGVTRLVQDSVVDMSSAGRPGFVGAVSTRLGRYPLASGVGVHWLGGRLRPLVKSTRTETTRSGSSRLGVSTSGGTMRGATGCRSAMPDRHDPGKSTALARSEGTGPGRSQQAENNRTGEPCRGDGRWLGARRRPRWPQSEERCRQDLSVESASVGRRRRANLCRRAMA